MMFPLVKVAFHVQTFPAYQLENMNIAISPCQNNIGRNVEMVREVKKTLLAKDQKTWLEGQLQYCCHKQSHRTTS